MFTFPSTRLATMQCWIDGVFERLVHVGFERNLVPAPPAVIGGDDGDALRVVDAVTIESGEKPPKITECGAPMRAHASSATGSSGIIGM